MPQLDLYFFKHLIIVLFIISFLLCGVFSNFLSYIIYLLIWINNIIKNINNLIIFFKENIKEKKNFLLIKFFKKEYFYFNTN